MKEFFSIIWVIEIKRARTKILSRVYATHNLQSLDGNQGSRTPTSYLLCNFCNDWWTAYRMNDFFARDCHCCCAFFYAEYFGDRTVVAIFRWSFEKAGLLRYDKIQRWTSTARSCAFWFHPDVYIYGFKRTRVFLLSSSRTLEQVQKNLSTTFPSRRGFFRMWCGIFLIDSESNHQSCKNLEWHRKLSRCRNVPAIHCPHNGPPFVRSPPTYYADNQIKTEFTCWRYAPCARLVNRRLQTVHPCLIFCRT